MPYVLDTNILLRSVAPGDHQHQVAIDAIERLSSAGEELVTTAQNFVELWNVVTRPVEANGLGRSPDVAREVVGRLETAFPRIPEPPNVYELWRDLVVRFEVSGVKVHDTRIVAVMLGNEVQNILSFNASDFNRFSALGIRAVDPRKM